VTNKFSLSMEMLQRPFDRGSLSSYLPTTFTCHPLPATNQLTFVANRRRTIAGPQSGLSDSNEVAERAFPVQVP